MPTIPTRDKLFFCRITLPYSDETIQNTSPYIKCKLYTHYFSKYFFVHEIGLKTQQPHYHLLIVCKTTKTEITKWIKKTFNVKGNEEFQITDKYHPDSWKHSLAYMYKDGKNTIYDNTHLNKFEQNLDVILESELTEININKIKITIDKKFEYYYDLINNAHGGNAVKNLIDETRDVIFGRIYKILMYHAIKSRKMFRKNIISEHAFVFTCHFANQKQVSLLIQEQIEHETEKHLNL